jgi:5-methylcytosine-specific restriction endonuclease McrA
MIGYHNHPVRADYRYIFRDGTLYRVLLPEEIEVCQRRRANQSERPSISAGEHEADFYNIRENRLKIYERDNYLCAYCGKQLIRFTVTLDHITPISEGGDNTAENLETAGLQCNSRKTAPPLGDFLVENELPQPGNVTQQCPITTAR